MKTCFKCKSRKPISEFHRSKGRKDGRHTYCRRCCRTAVIGNCNFCGTEATSKELDVLSQTCKKCLFKSGQKRCSSCRDLKPLTNFCSSSKRADGFHVYCRQCVAEKQAARVEDTAAYKRKWTYGLDEENYLKLLTEQDGKCFICQEPEHRTRRGKLLPLQIDHCHESGSVRGLLCTDCNLGLGRFRNSQARLSRAILYLERSGNE